MTLTILVQFTIAATLANVIGALLTDYLRLRYIGKVAGDAADRVVALVQAQQAAAPAPAPAPAKRERKTRAAKHPTGPTSPPFTDAEQNAALARMDDDGGRVVGGAA